MLSGLEGLTPSSCRDLWPLAEFFFALQARKELIMLFVLRKAIKNNKRLSFGHFPKVALTTPPSFWTSAK